MRATIYHNPACSTSLRTLAILQEHGAEIELREYLRHPPTRAELQRLYQRAEMTPREGLRVKEPLAAELGLLDPATSDERILDAMIAHPRLIERPLVETGKGVKLCRPQERVRELL